MDFVQWPSNLVILALVPILIFLSPHLVRYIVSTLLKYRLRTDKQVLETEIKLYRSQLSKISQTDEFAKYSKIQRKLRATTDQLGAISRQDLELHIKYTLAVQALVWLIAVLFALRLLHQSYILVCYYLGFV